MKKRSSVGFFGSLFLSGGLLLSHWDRTIDTSLVSLKLAPLRRTGSSNLLESAWFALCIQQISIVVSCDFWHDRTHAYILSSRRRGWPEPSCHGLAWTVQWLRLPYHEKLPLTHVSPLLLSCQILRSLLGILQVPEVTNPYLWRSSFGGFTPH